MDDRSARRDVALLGLGTARTDSLGGFAFRGVPAGTLLVRVQRIGFAPIMQSIAFDGVRAQRLTLRFGETTAMLAPVVVRDSANPAREPSGFDRRRLTGHGLYLTEADISTRRAQRVEHLLAMVPGLEVDTSGVVRTDRGRTSLFGDNCRDGVQLIVDGVPVAGSYTLRNMSPGAIRGIEIYRGVASTPVELRSARVACGTVVIWTK
jgi:Outer membrane cobalamin receptor protein